MRSLIDNCCFSILCEYRMMPGMARLTLNIVLLVWFYHLKVRIKKNVTFWTRQRIQWSHIYKCFFWLNIFKTNWQYLCNWTAISNYQIAFFAVVCKCEQVHGMLHVVSSFWLTYQLEINQIISHSHLLYLYSLVSC